MNCKPCTFWSVHDHCLNTNIAKIPRHGNRSLTPWSFPIPHYVRNGKFQEIGWKQPLPLAVYEIIPPVTCCVYWLLIPGAIGVAQAMVMSYQGSFSILNWDPELTCCLHLILSIVIYTMTPIKHWLLLTGGMEGICCSTWNSSCSTWVLELSVDQLITPFVCRAFFPEAFPGIRGRFH